MTARISAVSLLVALSLSFGREPLSATSQNVVPCIAGILGSILSENPSPASACIETVSEFARSHKTADYTPAAPTEIDPGIIPDSEYQRIVDAPATLRFFIKHDVAIPGRSRFTLNDTYTVSFYANRCRWTTAGKLTRFPDGDTRARVSVDGPMESDMSLDLGRKAGSQNNLVVGAHLQDCLVPGKGQMVIASNPNVTFDTSGNVYLAGTGRIGRITAVQ